MKWSEIRRHYPQCWVLIEAINAHSENELRILDDISVINTFKDSPSAMKEYSRLHHEIPTKELYVLHTSRKTIEISERSWLGIRAI